MVVGEEETMVVGGGRDYGCRERTMIVGEGERQWL